MAAGYLEILRARHAMRLLTGTLVGRLPNATAAIALVLFVRAGAARTAWRVLSRRCTASPTPSASPSSVGLVDVYGQPRVQLPAAVLSALAMTGFAFTGTDPLPLAYACVAAAGLFTPPLEGGLRALWPSVLRREEHVHRAYALDAVAQEVMFAVGPLLVTLCVSLWSERAALLVLNAVGVLGALSVVVSPPSRAWRSAPREAHWLGALRSRGLLAMLGAFLFVGIALGSITVASVPYADEHGGDAVYGWLMAGIGLGALLGGLAYGARQWAGEPARRLQVLVGFLAVCYVPLTLMPGAVGMTLLSVLAGVFLAPVIACAFVLVDRHAPAYTVTEAFSWLVTTFTVGASVGTGLVSPVVERGGALWGFAVPGVAGGVSLLVLLVTGSVLTAPVGRAVVAASSENDPNRAAEPRFSSGDRA